MPTHDETAAFLRVWGKMDGNARAAFLNAMSLLVEWLRQPDNPPPRTLRLHPVGHHPVYGTVWSMTWAPDGRGLFVYGAELRPGDPHVIWTAIGGHNVYR